MNTSWFASPEWLALVHALLHTLWEGALAAGALFLLLSVLPARRARLRYGLAVGALLSVLLMGVLGWAALDAKLSLARAESGIRGNGAPVVAAPAPQPSAAAPVAVAPIVPAARPATAMPPPAAPAWPRWVAAFWLIGVAICLVRTFCETLGAGRLRRRCEALLDPHLLALAEELRGCLCLPRRVRLMISDDLAVPGAVGGQADIPDTGGCWFTDRCARFRGAVSAFDSCLLSALPLPRDP